MLKLQITKKKMLLFGLLIIFLIFSTSYLVFAKRIIASQKDSTQITTVKSSQKSKIAKPTVTPNTTATPTPVPTPTPTLNRTWPVILSYEKATSLTVVVNKKHQLPSDYIPDDLVALSNGQQVRQIVIEPFNQMVNDATAAGLQATALSAYRSYQNQAAIYNNYVNQYGQSEADTFSARPGFSEHQTGLAIDIGMYGGACNLETCLGESPLGKWIAANAPNYGFIVRYPLGKEEITGYQYEPWHLRYVGINTAKAITASGETMDEYFGVLAGDYQ